MDNFNKIKSYSSIIISLEILFLITLLSFNFFSCDAPQPWPDNPTDNRNTRVRFLNFISNQKSIDIYVDDKVFISGLKPFHSSKVMNINHGYRKIKITENGTVNELFSANLLIDSAKSNQIGFHNRFPTIQYFKNIEKGTLPSQNKVSLKVSNLSEDIPNMDLQLRINSAEFIISNITFNSSSPYTDFNFGNTVMIFINKVNNSVSLSSSLVTSANKIYSIFYLGKSLNTDTLSNALQILDETNNEEQKLVNPLSGLTRLRILNNFTANNFIEVWVDSLKILSQLDRNQISDFNFISPGNRKLRIVNPFGQIIKDTTINFIENKKYTYVISSLNNTASSVFYEIKDPITVSFRSYIRICNLSPSFTTFDLKIKSPFSTEQTISNLGYGQITNYFQINSDTNTISINLNNNTKYNFVFKPTEKSFYSLFLLGSVSDTGNNSFNFYYTEDSDTSIQNLYKINYQRAPIRFVNCVSSLPSLNFVVDALTYYSNAEFKSSSGVVNLPVGLREFNLYDNSFSTLNSLNYNVTSDKNYLYIASRKGIELSPFVVVSNLKKPIANRASIRFINAMSEDLKLNISITNSIDAISLFNLKYSEASEYYDVNSIGNQIVVKNADNDDELITNITNFTNNKVYTIIILGSNSDPNNINSLNILDESIQSAQKLQAIQIPNSQIRFINASIDAPSLDLLVNYTTEISSMNFRSASKITEFPGGGRNVKVKNSTNQAVLIDTNYSFFPSKRYVALVSNRFSKLDLTIFETPQKTAPTDGNSVRFVNCAFDLGSLDISITNTIGKQSFTGLAYKSSTSYFDLPVQLNEIIVTLSSNGKIIATANATFEKEKVYTGYIIGSTDIQGKTDYSIYFVNDSNNSEQVMFTYAKLSFAQLRIINASPNSTSFDVTIDGQNWVDNLGYTNTSGYKLIKTSLRNIKIFRTGSTNPSIDFVYNFINEKVNTLFITDSVQKVSPLMIEDMNVTPIAGQAFVRFINLSPNSLPLDVKLGSGIGIIKHSALTFKQITTYLNYDPTTYSFIITESGKTTEVASIKAFTLLPNKYYTFVIVGFRNGPVGQNLELKWYPDN